MAARTIVMFPDRRLRLPCPPVAGFGPALAALARDLEDSMRAAVGVGITAPHVGELIRVTVIDLGQDLRVYVNPLVAWRSEETATHEEGSISMPGVSETVTRPARIRVEYQDLQGAPRSEEADGFRAACLQHEIDQLDGVFWLERLSRLRRDRLARRYEKLRR